MASTESPKAKEIPTAPTYDPAKVTLPQPMKTRTNVPRNSAAYFFAGFSLVSMGISVGFSLSMPFGSIPSCLRMLDYCLSDFFVEAYNAFQRFYCHQCPE